MNELHPNQSGFTPSLPVLVRTLIVINVVMYVLTRMTEILPENPLALWSIHTPYFEYYQLITHMFLHGGMGHIFMNMFGLYMFGEQLEALLGRMKFLTLYFVSGLGAAALQLLVYYLQAEPAAMIGASGAVFGILAAYAMYFPNVKLMLLFLPVPIKAKYFVPIYGVIELILGTANFEFSNIAHFAHLGGAIVGFLLVLIWKKKGHQARQGDNPNFESH